MAKYLYVLSVPKTLTVFESTELQKDLSRVFQTEQITASTATEFKLFSPLDPGQIEPDFRKLIGKYGPLEIRAGAKLE